MAKGYLTIVNGFGRVDNQPLTNDELFDSMVSAQSFASGPTSYPGKIICVLVGSEYQPYIVQTDKTLKPLINDQTSWDTWE